MSEFVWVEGGVVQDHSPNVAVIDTDISDFPDVDDLHAMRDTLAIAKEANAPDYVVEAVETAIDSMIQRGIAGNP
jgi:hypothetical protein